MKKLINILTYTIFFLIVALFIWVRYLKNKLPTSIPLTLNSISTVIIILCILMYFISLIIMLLVFCNISIKLLNTNYFNVIINRLIGLIFNEEAIEILALLLSRLIKTYEKSLNKLYIISELIPSVILSLVFALDVFYYAQINNFYNFIFLSIPILIIKVLLLFCIYVKNQNLKRIEDRAEIYCFNYKNDYNVPKIIGSNHFVEEESLRILQNKGSLEYSISFKLSFIQALRQKLNIPDNYRINIDKFNAQITEGLNLCVSLNKLIILVKNTREAYTPLNIIIKLNYVICWSYILYTSDYKSFVDILENLVIIYKYIEEPFSGLFL